jgi:hypothetical protein
MPAESAPPPGYGSVRTAIAIAITTNTKLSAITPRAPRAL